LLGPPQREEMPSKNKRMLLSAASTRYSLVKGERIVRYVLTAQLRELQQPHPTLLNSSAPATAYLTKQCGTKPKRRSLARESWLMWTTHRDRLENFFLGPAQRMTPWKLSAHFVNHACCNGKLVPFSTEPTPANLSIIRGGFISLPMYDWNMKKKVGYAVSRAFDQPLNACSVRPSPSPSQTRCPHAPWHWSIWIP
jgi:hypothetical protein